MKNQANWSCWPVEKKVEGNPCLLCKAVNTDNFVKFFDCYESPCQNSFVLGVVILLISIDISITVTGP